MPTLSSSMLCDGKRVSSFFFAHVFFFLLFLPPPFVPRPRVPVRKPRSSQILHEPCWYIAHHSPNLVLAEPFCGSSFRLRLDERFSSDYVQSKCQTDAPVDGRYRCYPRNLRFVFPSKPTMLVLPARTLAFATISYLHVIGVTLSVGPQRT